MAEDRRSGNQQSIEIYDLLSHPLRRRLLLELPNHDNPVRLNALVDRVTRSETLDATARHDRPTNPDAVRAELHHIHLPKLAAADWIEYDSENEIIRYESRIGTIRSALQTTVDELDQLRVAFDERTGKSDSR